MRNNNSTFVPLAFGFRSTWHPRWLAWWERTSTRSFWCSSFPLPRSSCGAPRSTKTRDNTLSPCRVGFRGEQSKTPGWRCHCLYTNCIHIHGGALECLVGVGRHQRQRTLEERFIFKLFAHRLQALHVLLEVGVLPHLDLLGLLHQLPILAYWHKHTCPPSSGTSTICPCPSQLPGWPPSSSPCATPSLHVASRPPPCTSCCAVRVPSHHAPTVVSF